MKPLTVLSRALAFLVFACFVAHGGTTGKIAGRVVDASSGEGLPGVNVVITGIWTGGKESPVSSVQGVATDAEGRFFLLNIPPGSYSVEASHVGYNKSKAIHIAVTVDRTTPLDFRLTSEAVEVGEVVVTGERRGVIRDLTSASAKIGTEQIQSLPVENFTDVLVLQAGVTTDADGGLHIRGGRSSEIQYYVDGIAVSNPFNNNLAVPVENNAIQELEVISGTFNAEYGQALSGIVNIVTKEGTERYSASFSAYGGDFFTNHTDVFIGLDKHELRQKYLEGSLSGPVPGIEIASLFLSGRLVDEKNQYYGQRIYNIYDSSYISGQDPAGWYIERTGDGAWVPMAPSNSFSYNAKLSLRFSPVFKVGYTFIGNNGKAKPYIHSELYNPDYSPTRYSTSYGHSLKVNHSLSPSTFYVLNVSLYYDRLQSYVFEDPFDPRYAALFGRGNVPADVFATGGVDGTHSDQKGITAAGRFDISSQVNFTHLLKGGAEFRYNDLSTDAYTLVVDPNQFGDKVPRIPPLTSTQHNSYARYPYEFAVYLQDKIEVRDLIINLGLRYDYFNSQGTVPTDFLDPANDIYPRSTSEAYRKATPNQQLSPRLGLAFPITERGVLHASYGQFFQIPPLSALFENPGFKVVSPSFSSYIGNADLEPQRSTMYELGLQQQMSDNMYADLTAFYRDVRHLLGTKLYATYIAGQDYGRYYNVDYGGVTGLTVSLQFRPSATGIFSGSLDYTYQVVQGNGSDPKQAFFDAANGDESTKYLIPLSWDVRHNVYATLMFSDRVWGLTVIGSYKSGYPFTPTGFPELRNADRLLSLSNVNLQLYRNIPIGDVAMQVFLRVDNLFDQYTQDAVPKIDPREVAAYQFESLNSIYAYRNNPLAYAAPRLIKLGFKVDY